MTEQASFTLRNRNPDVLTCIANLSNDEVFTPPDLANQMLDKLTEAWANDNNGENIWENKEVKFQSGCHQIRNGMHLKIDSERVQIWMQVYRFSIDKIYTCSRHKRVFCSTG